MNRKGKLERQKAYHEAGRAVVARTLGITMSHVTMLSTDDMTAGSALADSASWLARDADQATRLAAIEKDMKACSPARMRRRGISRAKASASQTNGLATLSWQRLCDKGGPDQDRTRSRYPDRRRRLRDVLGADDLAEIARLFNRISNETEALVAKLWPAITLVAEELLTRRTLFEDEVDALIERTRLTGGEPAL